MISRRQLAGGPEVRPHDMRNRRRRKSKGLGVGELVTLAVDALLVVLWVVGGSQLMLGVLLAGLLVLSAAFLGWVPLPGDKRRRM